MTVFSENRFRILIVDALSDQSLLLQILLETEGYAVEIVESGTLALAQLKTNPPDLALLNAILPDTTGSEVIRQIRQNSTLPLFPILLMSAQTQEDVIQALNSGANDCIQMPFNSDELLARIRAFLRLRQQNVLSRTVLVIEDSPFDALHLERVFRQLKLTLQIHRVDRAEDAMAYLQGEGVYHDRDRYPLPNFAVLDLKLPGMSGLDFLRWLRQHPTLQQLHVIGMTGYGNRELPQAYDLGINFYLLKPIEANTLTEVLQGLSLV